MRAAGTGGWPDLFTALVQCLGSNDETHTDGALDVVFKVCEELNGRLDSPVPGLPEGSAAAMLIPRLLVGTKKI